MSGRNKRKLPGRCGYCAKRLPPPKTKYCDGRCRAGARRWRRKERCFDPFVGQQFLVRDMAARYGVTVDELIRRAQSKVERGELIAYPSLKNAWFFGVPKPDALAGRAEPPH